MGWIRATMAFAMGAIMLAAACSSKATDGSPGELTFSTVEPIIQERCQGCHREGGIAPFPLVSYADFRRVGGLAKEKVSAREMPPWGAFEDEACTPRFGWKGDLRMKDEEITKLVSWIDAGMPEGDPAARPPAKAIPPTGLAGKTHALAMAAPYEVPAGGRDDFRCFPIDPGFAEDTWVSGVNVVPGDPRAVHHVLVYVDPNRDSLTKAAAAGSYPCFGGPEVTGAPSLLLAWAPGVPPLTFGQDVGMKIAKSAMLVMQVHYHPYAETAHDKTSFELAVMPNKPSFVANVLLLGAAPQAASILKILPGPDDPPSGPAFVIPANAKHHVEASEIVVPEKIRGITLPTSGILGVGTHMHLAGVDMKLEIERKSPPPGQPGKECLIGTPKYDFNWQRGYAYDTDIDALPVLSAGDTLRFTCTYDNSMENRRVAAAVQASQLPGPKEIRLGEGTLDEMCLGALITVRRASAIDF